MSAFGAEPASEPRLIYRAGPSILYKVIVGMLLLIASTPLLGWTALALLAPERPQFLLAAIPLLALVVVDRMILLMLRPAFAMTSRGVELRGGVVIVTRDGRRLKSALTNAHNTLYRGEPLADHGPELMHAARPARAAIQTHRRWLHGAL